MGLGWTGHKTVLTSLVLEAFTEVCCSKDDYCWSFCCCILLCIKWTQKYPPSITKEILKVLISNYIYIILYNYKTINDPRFKGISTFYIYCWIVEAQNWNDRWKNRIRDLQIFFVPVFFSLGSFLAGFSLGLSWLSGIEAPCVSWICTWLYRSLVSSSCI